MTEPSREALIVAHDLMHLNMNMSDDDKARCSPNGSQMAVARYIDATNAKLAERDAEVAQWQRLHRDNCAAYAQADAEREHFRNMVPTADMIPRAQVEEAIKAVEGLSYKWGLQNTSSVDRSEVLAILSPLVKPKVTLFDRAFDNAVANMVSGDSLKPAILAEIKKLAPEIAAKLGEG